MSPRQLAGQLNLSRPKNRWDLVAKSATPVSVVAGLFGFRFPDITVQLISALFPLFCLFITTGYISKVSVPEALAINYFKSFVQPIAEVMRTDKVEIVYDSDKPGTEPILAPDLKKLNPKLRILMPKDLSVTTTGKWLPELPKTRGIIHAKTPLDEPRDYTVRLDPNNAEGFLIFDVPNNLTALRQLQFEDKEDEKTDTDNTKRVERAAHALEEYSKKLNSDVVKAEFDRVLIIPSETGPQKIITPGD